jgi:hypothetical protein
MKNLKPSQLPEDTVINDKAHGVWMKEESGVWGEMTPHCSDCAQAVRDDGTLKVWIDNKEVLIASDEFFTEFKVVSLPYSIFEAMATLVGVDWLSTKAEVLNYVLGFIKDSEDGT